MEDEIDLRKYIAVLGRHWKLIAIITGTAVIVATLVSFLSPPIYEATSSLLITKVRAEIVLVPEYRTAAQQDSSSMRQALLALAKSPAVANQVIKQLGNELEPHEQKTSKMLAKIEVSSEGDLIRITAKSNNPQRAVTIANAWAESYKGYINELYSGLLESSQELKSQADTAEKEYKEKQKALEDFIRDNRIAELSQQINDKEILYDARLLREYIKSSPSSASSTANSLALVLLQTRAFTSLSGESQASTSLPSGPQISLGPLSISDANLSAVDALISTLESRSGGKKGQSLAELHQDIRLLRAELEQETAQQREIEGARDIAWEAYTTVADKIVETEVAVQGQDGVIKIARFADEPISPAGPHKVTNIVIALVLGLIVSIFAAFGIEYFKKA